MRRFVSTLYFPLDLVNCSLCSASSIGLPGPKPPIICKYRRGVILLRPLFPQFPEISRWAPNYGWPAGACLSARSPTIGRNLTASSPGYFWATAPIGPQSWQKAVQKPKIAQAEPMPGIGCQGGEIELGLLRFATTPTDVWGGHNFYLFLELRFCKSIGEH